MIVLFLLACLIIFFISKRRFSYWRSLQIPQEKNQKFLFGDLKDVATHKKSLGEFFINFYEKNKNHKIFGVYFSYAPLLVINDFEIAKRILTKDFHHFQNRGIFDDEEIDPLAGNLFCLSGEKWKSLRQKVTPLFSSAKLKLMMPVIDDSLTTLETFIEKNCEKIDFDVKDLCARFTMTLISSVAFGIDNDSINEPGNAFNEMSLSILEPNTTSNLRLILGVFYPALFKFFKISLFKPTVASFYSKITHDNMKYRKANSITRNDFFQLFMQLHDQGLTMNRVTANSFLFVLAGYETTSSTITFCLYEIAKNLEIQRKIQSEIEKFSAENLNDLKYLDKCIEETLRKYPIVPMLNRVCEHDYEIKEANFTIKKGTSLIIPTVGFQRDPQVYENPLEFNPDRTQVHSMSFGIGQRACPGNRMASLVTKLTIVKILSKFNLKLVQPTSNQLTFNPKVVTLMSNENILIKFSHR